MSIPLHAIELRISIGAHAPQYAAQVLQELADKMRSGDLNNCASGGWDGSYSVTRVNRDITPNQYRDELEAWRKAGA